MEFAYRHTDFEFLTPSSCAVDTDWNKGHSLRTFDFLNSESSCKYDFRLALSQTTSNLSQKNILASEGFRLCTLHLLPASCTVSRIRLAYAGFYFDANMTIRDDSNINEVVCYSCGLHYGNWDATTHPVTIHRELHPGCLHLKSLPPIYPDGAPRGKEKLESDRMVQFSTLSADSSSSPLTQIEASNSCAPSFCYETSPDPTTSGDREPLFATANRSQENGAKITSSDLLLSNNHEAQPNALARLAGGAGSAAREGDTLATDVQHQLPRTSSYSLPPQSLKIPAFPQFESTQIRLATFTKWPSSYAFPVNFEQIVMCGFYFAGYADCLRCFYCGVGLKSWENNYDMVLEHWKLSRQECVFLQRYLAQKRNPTASSDNTTRDFRQQSIKATFNMIGKMGFFHEHIVTAFMELRMSDKRGVNLEALVDRILEISSRNDAINSTNPSSLSASDIDIDGPEGDSPLGKDRIVSKHWILTRSLSCEADM